MKVILIFSLLATLTSCGKHEISRPDFSANEVTESEEVLSAPERALLELQSGNTQAFIQIVTSEALALNQVLKNGNTFLIEAVLWQRVEIVRITFI